MNNGQVNADKSLYGDERYTPHYAVQPLLKYLDKSKIIWCPFDEDWSAFPQVLLENDFMVVNSSLEKGQNFFDYEPEQWDILISNPPFSKKENVLQRIQSFNKPYALLLPLDTLQSQKYFKYFTKGLQLLLFNQRVEYFKYPDFENVQKGISFSSAYFCRDLLPKDLIVEPITRVQRSLLTATEAQKYNLKLYGSNELDMFDMNSSSYPEIGKEYENIHTKERRVCVEFWGNELRLDDANSSLDLLLGEFVAEWIKVP